MSPTLEGWVYIEPIHGPLDGPLTHGLNILQQIYKKRRRGEMAYYMLLIYYNYCLIIIEANQPMVRSTVRIVLLRRLQAEKLRK